MRNKENKWKQDVLSEIFTKIRVISTLRPHDPLQDRVLGFHRKPSIETLQPIAPPLEGLLLPQNRIQNFRRRKRKPLAYPDGLDCPRKLPRQQNNNRAQQTNTTTIRPAFHVTSQARPHPHQKVQRQTINLPHESPEQYNTKPEARNAVHGHSGNLRLPFYPKGIHDNRKHSAKHYYYMTHSQASSANTNDTATTVVAHTRTTTTAVVTGAAAAGTKKIKMGGRENTHSNNQTQRLQLKLSATLTSTQQQG